MLPFMKQSTLALKISLFYRNLTKKGQLPNNKHNILLL